MAALSPLDRLQRTCNRAAVVGVVVAIVGAVVAAVLPARDLPLTLVISAVGLWLVAMGLWGRRKVDRVRQNRLHKRTEATS
jgi:hypothetical protein